jgi:hypothetical protein
MQLEILTLCREARYNGQVLDILGSFDVFMSPRAPVVVPECSIAGRVRFERIEEGPHQFRIYFMDADGRPVVPDIHEDVNVTFPHDLPTVYKAFALHFRDLRLPDFGEYAIKVAVDRMILASVPVYCLRTP